MLRLKQQAKRFLSIDWSLFKEKGIFRLLSNVILDIDDSQNSHQDAYYILVSQALEDRLVTKSCGQQIFFSESYDSFLFNYFSKKVTHFEDILYGKPQTDLTEYKKPEIRVTLDSKKRQEFELNFWHFLLDFPEDKTLVLYFDKNLFDNFLSKYFCILYPKSKPEFVHLLYKLTQMNYKFCIAYSCSNEDLKLKYKNLLFFSEKDFKKIQQKNSIIIEKIPEISYDKIPIDYLLAYCLSSDNSQAKDALLKRIKRILESMALKWVRGVQRSFLMSLLDLESLFPSLKGLDPFREDILGEIVSLDKRFEFLLLDKIYYLDLKKYGKDIYEIYFETYTSSLFRDIPHMTDEEGMLLKMILEGEESEVIINVLQKDSLSSTLPLIFEAMIKIQQTNPFLISFVYKNALKNKIEEFKNLRCGP